MSLSSSVKHKCQSEQFSSSFLSGLKMEVKKRLGKYEPGFLSIPTPCPLKFLCLTLKLKWKSAYFLTMTNPVSSASVCQGLFSMSAGEYLFHFLSPSPVRGSL